MDSPVRRDRLMSRGFILSGFDAGMRERNFSRAALYRLVWWRECSDYFKSQRLRRRGAQRTQRNQKPTGMNQSILENLHAHAAAIIVASSFSLCSRCPLCLCVGIDPALNLVLACSASSALLCALSVGC